MGTHDHTGAAGGAASRLLSSSLRTNLELDPDAIAITFGADSYPWSYYTEAIAALETALAAHPDARRIGLVLRNRPGPLAALIATLATECELVTLSPHLGDVGLAEDIVELRPDVVIADDEDWAREPVQLATRKVKAIALRTGPDRAVEARDVDWVASPALEPAGEIAVLMMTSGTTGRPKRVELTYPQMVASFRAAGVPLPIHEPPHLRSRSAILWASLAHISGMYFAIAHILEGRPVALLEKFEVDAWVGLVRQHRPGFVRLAPVALRMVLNGDVPADTFDSVRAVGSGTAPLPPELAQAFEDRFGVPVLGTYGATEFAGAIAGWTLKDKQEWGAKKPGSVGRPYHGIELRIVDRDSGLKVALGGTGLLEARGGQLPGEGAAWVRTTDLASIDTDGFLYIHGRADDAINRGGFKIPPSVIEDALRTHPAVSEASALAISDPRLGEVPVAAVTLQSPATEDELMTYLAGRLTRYQCPTTLRIVDELPRTPSLKVSRALVRELYFTEPKVQST